MEGFSGLRAGIASMHGKAAAIAPPLERLGLAVETVEGLDTVRFGTFTGEIERQGVMISAARAKVRAALSLTKAELVIASEGAFGPHPAVPLLASGRELILVHDRRSGLEMVEQTLTLETNYERLELAAGADPDAFLQRIGFPDHAVIVPDAPGRDRQARADAGAAPRDALSRLRRAGLRAGPRRAGPALLGLRRADAADALRDLRLPRLRP